MQTQNNKNMKKILKGILLWVTTLAIMLSICGIDGVVNMGVGVTLAWIAVCLSLINLCRIHLSIRDLYTLSGYKLFYKLLR